ncbi:MAG: LysR family transcriptional regulator [Clostridia bacterium]|nr:LysR family transcriptional regulator [Clostridia bacterium]
MIEIYLIEQLVAFARHGTLLRAAEELHITQPALSRSMKKIEEQLGVQIFDRQNSKISLNETGRLAADYAARVLQADREMIERVTAFDRSQRTISIGSCAPFPLQEIIPVLQDNMIGMAITSEIVEEDERLITGLKNHIYQLVILHEKTEETKIFCQRYLDEKLYVTFSQDHPLAGRVSVSFDDLKDTRILVSA